MTSWIADFIAAPKSVAFAPDSKLAVSASDDLSVRLWEVATGKEVDRLDLGGATDYARSFAFSADGRTLLIGTASWVVLRLEVR